MGTTDELPRAVDALPRLRPTLPNGHYRFYRDHDLLESRFGARYVGEMDRMFDTYAELLPVLTEWLTKKFPKTPEDTDFVYRQAIRAKALDATRGLLPASALSNLGIYASGQAYESLLLHMRAHPLLEVRLYGQLMLDELVKVIPSFLKRVDVPERGVAWSTYMAETKSATRDLVESMWATTVEDEPTEQVRLVSFDPERRDPRAGGDRLRQLHGLARRGAHRAWTR